MPKFFAGGGAKFLKMAFFVERELSTKANFGNYAQRRRKAREGKFKKTSGFLKRHLLQNYHFVIVIFFSAKMW